MSGPREDPLSDELAARLRALPAPDVAPDRAARIRRIAHARLERSAWRSRRPWVGRLLALYDRLEPALVLAASAVYLHWAVSTVLALQPR